MTERHESSMRVSERLQSRMVRVWMQGAGIREPGYGWRPPTNVFETAEGALIQVEVAGLADGDYRVRLAQTRRLSVTGVRRRPSALGSCTSCRQIEIAGGRFKTDVELPWPADPERLNVDYREGFLFVELRRDDTDRG